MAKKRLTADPPRIAAEQLVTVPISKLVPSPTNPRIHGEAQLKQLRRSLRKFGFVTPVLIDFDYNIIAGHGRIEAAKAEGMTEVPCVMVSDLTEEQRRAYIIADNKLTENATWDQTLLMDELEYLKAMEFPVELTGFQLQIDGSCPDAVEMETSDEYEAFVDKFKPKATSDDCFTPPAVYEAVKEWAVKEYGLEGRKIVRPFFPGGDYQNADYPEGCVVIDNPPFSILSEICRWYRENDVDFFLFAPTLTLFSVGSGEFHYLVTDARVTYENGAEVNTSFVTNLGRWRIALEPSLFDAVAEADVGEAPGPGVSHYEYPDEVASAANLTKLIRNGIELRIPDGEAVFIRALDAQKQEKTGIFGGVLLSTRMAEAKTAAERQVRENAAPAIRLELSEREREIVRSLDERG